MHRNILILFIVLSVSQTVYAVPTSTAAREVGEFVVKKFGGTIGKETVETIAEKTITLSSKYGDDVAVDAIKKVGPQTFRIVEKAGTQGDAAIKLLAKYGDNAVLLAEKPSSLKLFTQYGDNAAEAMIKHGDNADALMTAYGKSAAGALANVDKQTGRRLMQMSVDGDLAKIGRSDELLAVIEKYGDKGADFIWRNKGALAVGTGLTAFLAEPQLFIDGTIKLGEKVVQPIVVEGTKTVGENILGKLPWTLITVIFAGFLAIRFRKILFPRKKKRKIMKEKEEREKKNVTVYIDGKPVLDV